MIVGHVTGKPKVGYLADLLLTHQHIPSSQITMDDLSARRHLKLKVKLQRLIHKLFIILQDISHSFVIKYLWSLWHNLWTYPMTGKELHAPGNLEGKKREVARCDRGRGAVQVVVLCVSAGCSQETL